MASGVSAVGSPMTAMLARQFAPITVQQPQVVQAPALPMLTPPPQAQDDGGGITFGPNAPSLFAGRTFVAGDPLFEMARQAAARFGTGA